MRKVCRASGWRRGNFEGFYENEHALVEGMVYEGEHRTFTGLRQPGVLVHFSETPTLDNAAAAVLGQHSVEVLRGWGTHRKRSRR